MTGPACLIFTKDRPMQLDALLRSIRDLAPYQYVVVVQGAADGAMDLAYRTLRAELRDLYDGWFTDEADGLQNVVESTLRTFERVAFHTDDDLWFRREPAPLHRLARVYSFRLGGNTRTCHPLEREQEIPPGLDRGGILWEWAKGDGDFGYPLSLNATVYDSADLLPLLDFPFENPNELEAGLDGRRHRFEPTRIGCPPLSCVVSLPHNVVSRSSGNPRGWWPAWQPDRLLADYLDGWRIDREAMDFSDVHGAHQEIPLSLTMHEELRVYA